MTSISFQTIQEMVMISQMIHIEYAVFVAYHAADASFFIKPIDFHTVY